MSDLISRQAAMENITFEKIQEANKMIRSITICIMQKIRKYLEETK